MSYDLQTGQDDLSAVLNDATTQTTTSRKTHHNDAVQKCCRKRKWQFLIKNSTVITVAIRPTTAFPPTSPNQAG